MEGGSAQSKGRASVRGMEAGSLQAFHPLHQRRRMGSSQLIDEPAWALFLRVRRRPARCADGHMAHSGAHELFSGAGDRWVILWRFPPIEHGVVANDAHMADPVRFRKQHSLSVLE
jgi:hypothetical protein